VALVIDADGGVRGRGHEPRLAPDAPLVIVSKRTFTRLGGKPTYVRAHIRDTRLRVAPIRAWDSGPRGVSQAPVRATVNTQAAHMIPSPNARRCPVMSRP
jgi:hypothetical protein